MSTQLDPLPPRLPRSLTPRGVSRRALTVLVALVVAGVGVGVTGAIPALASSLPAALTGPPSEGPAKERDAAPVQSYTVPAAVAHENATRTAEVQVVATRVWIDPATGELRDGYGARPIAPVAGVSRFHSGQDIGAPCGAPIRAVTAGRVTQSGWGGSYGKRIVLQSAGGLQTVYAHASRLLVRAGAKVEAGARIADVGTTGASTGCHLHFEVHVKKKAVNPTAFMRQRGVKLGG